MIKAENARFDQEKKCVDDAEVESNISKTEAEEEKQHAELAGKWPQELETKKIVMFKERVSGFLYSTWLQFLEMNFYFLGDAYTA